MSRLRHPGDFIAHPALPWWLMGIALVLASSMFLALMEDREEHARWRLTLELQRFALDLADAAQGGGGTAAARALLEGARGSRHANAVLSIDDVTDAARVTIYRTDAAVDPRSRSGVRGWVSEVLVASVAGRKWELYMAQPVHTLLHDDAGLLYAMLAGLLVIPFLSMMFWRLQRRGLRLQARRSYELLQTVIDSLPTPVFVKDAGHRYLVLNKAFGRAFNLVPQELIGKTDRAIHDDSIADSRFEEDDRALASDGIQVTTQSDQDDQGRTRHWLKSKAGLNLPEGGRGLCGILTEVTAQRVAEQQAHATRDFMQAVVDALPQPMYVKNDQLRWSLVNDAFARLMNGTKEELLSRTDTDYWDADTVRRYRDHDFEVLREGMTVAREEQVRLPGGGSAWLMTNKSLLTVEDGRKFVIGVIFDITAQRTSAQELEHAHQFLHAVIDSLPHSLVVKDASGHYLIVNRAWCEAVSIDSAKVLGRRAVEIFPEEIANQLEKQDAEAWATGGTVTAVQPRISLAGAKGWSLKSKRVVTLPNGRRFNVQVTTDVTAQQEALQEAQRSRELLRGVLDSIPNPLIVKDAKGRYALVNAAAGTLGVGKRMRVGTSDSEVFPEEICARYLAEDQAALSDPGTRWYSDHRVDTQGNERWWVKSKRAITVLGDETLIVTVLSDVTQLKVVERSLVRNQARLHVMHDLAMLMLRQADLQSLGRGACEVLARRLEGRKVSFADVSEIGLLKVNHHAGDGDLPDRTGWRLDLSGMPDLWHRFRHLDLIDAGDLAESGYPQSWRDGSGHEQPCETLFMPLMLGVRLAGVLIIDGAAAKPWAEHELQLIRESADHLRIACQAQQAELSRQSAATALRDSEAELRRHRDNLQVLVEERTRELTHAMQVAEVANQSKTQFFNNMSHELRTPMNSIISFAKLGLEKVKAGSFGADVAQLYLERIERSAARLLLLINDLLDLAKLEAGRMSYRFASRDLRILIGSVCEEFSALAAASRVGFHIECGLDRPAAWCDEVRMEQVMRNLLSNALRHSPEGGRVDIRITPSLSVVAPYEGEAEGQAGVEEGVEITVADQGPGIPPTELDSIFDKYVQSSRVRGGGTGLGLPIAREILRQHRGSIFASNGAQGGAVMTITLPVAAPAVTGAPESAPLVSVQ